MRWLICNMISMLDDGRERFALSGASRVGLVTSLAAMAGAISGARVYCNHPSESFHRGLEFEGLAHDATCDAPGIGRTWDTC